MSASNECSERVAREILHGKRLAAGQGAEEKWGWGTPAGQRRAERRAGLISRAVGLKSGMHVLEIGCGTGLFTEMFARSGARITAVDVSPDLLACARARNLPPEQVEFREMRFEDWPDGDAFDGILGSSVLHHLDIEQSIVVMFRLLKPGGRLGFAEPNYLNPQIFAERRFRGCFPNVSPDETAFIRWSVASLLRRHGFASVRVTPFDFLHPAVSRSLIPAVSYMGRVVEHMPLLREFSGSLLISAAKPTRYATEPNSREAFL